MCVNEIQELKFFLLHFHWRSQTFLNCFEKVKNLLEIIRPIQQTKNIKERIIKINKIKIKYRLQTFLYI